MFTNRQCATLLAIATLLLATASAQAATVRVSCEVRPDRARASVDAKGLAAGSYSTQIVSGGNMAAAPSQAAVGGEVQSDYDSNANDVRAGATAIPVGFVQGGMLTGKVVDASGNTVVADTVACRVRTR